MKRLGVVQEKMAAVFMSGKDNRGTHENRPHKIPEDLKSLYVTTFHRTLHFSSTTRGMLAILCVLIFTVPFHFLK